MTGTLLEHVFCFVSTNATVSIIIIIIIIIRNTYLAITLVKLGLVTALEVSPVGRG